MSDRITPILDAIVTKIQGLALAVGGVVLPVLKRKAAVHRDKLDPSAMITVAKSREAEDVRRWTFRELRTDYVVDVVIHSPHTGPDGNLSDYSRARDSLVDALSRPPLAGAPDVFDLRARPASWLQPYGEKTEWDWQALQVVASVISANGSVS